jgi:hypothetical protein
MNVNSDYNSPHVGGAASHEPSSIQTCTLTPLNVVPTSHVYLTDVCVPFELKLNSPDVGFVTVWHTSKNGRIIYISLELEVWNVIEPF